MSQAFTCVFDMGKGKKKKKCGVGDYDSGMRITACPFINLQSKSRFPARFCLLAHLQQHGDVEALTMMPCRFFCSKNRQPCKEIQ